MPRKSASSIEDVIEQAVAAVVARMVARIQRGMELQVAEGIRDGVAKAREDGRARGTRTRRRSAEMTRWAADRRARRVPNFVIEATGLDTKKKIVAKFGEGAEFVKGKPLPPFRATESASAQTKAARVVTPRQPIIRKRAAKDAA
jgi:hypothetical protein